MNAAQDLTIATNNGEVAGGEVMLLQVAQTAAALGVTPRIAAPTAPSDLLDQARAAGFDVEPIRAHDRPSYMRSLRDWDRQRSGLLWCNGLVPALATAGHPSRIVHLHRQPTGLQRAARSLAVRGAIDVLVPSLFMGRSVPHTRVLPNWTHDPGVVPERRRELEPVLGFLGRITLEKGVVVLADAVVRLAREGRPVHLVLAGESRFESADETRLIAAALRPIEDRVTRLGWVTPSEFFKRVDLAVFPSTSPETFGLVAAEAMAAEVPFVISDAGALTEVAGTDHPWVSRAGDAADLAATVARALDASDGDRAAALRRGRQRWEARFSPEAGQRRLAELLRTAGLAVV